MKKYLIISILMITTMFAQNELLNYKTPNGVEISFDKYGEISSIFSVYQNTFDQDNESKIIKSSEKQAKDNLINFFKNDINSSKILESLNSLDNDSSQEFAKQLVKNLYAYSSTLSKNITVSFKIDDNLVVATAKIKEEALQIAQIKKGAKELELAINELNKFYDNNDKFEDELNDMTTVKFFDEDGDISTSNSGYLRVGGKNCAFIGVVSKGSSKITKAKNDTFIYVLTDSNIDSTGDELDGMMILDEDGVSSELNKPELDKDPICKNFANFNDVSDITDKGSYITICTNDDSVYCSSGEYLKGIFKINVRGVRYEV